MPHSFGFRAGTRKKFQQAFRRKGAIRMRNYLRVYHVGDYVDIKVDPSQHKGMPHKFYHGRTGRIFNINPHSVGIKLLKLHRNRKIEKRFHVRVEHIRPSKSRYESPLSLLSPC